MQRNYYTTVKMQYRNNGGIQLHNGGIHIRRLGGTSANVEGGYMYSLEVPNVESDLASRDEVG